MKTITAKRLSLHPTMVEQVPQIMEQEGVKWTKVEVVNWENFPYKPDVSVRVAHSGDALHLQWRVREETVRAMASQDNGRVWCDSCCEFFCQPEENGPYYNVECNCRGTLLLGCGEGRERRELASPEVLSGVKRWSSLGRGVMEEQAAPWEWMLALTIPVQSFFRSTVKSLDGRTLLANFYKCGDEQQRPHFLSWNAIDVPRPDFHRPEFFGKLVCE